MQREVLISVIRESTLKEVVFELHRLPCIKTRSNKGEGNPGGETSMSKYQSVMTCKSEEFRCLVLGFMLKG